MLAQRYKRSGNMGRDNAHGGAAVGRGRTGGEVERKGTHTAGQGSGGDRTWADGWMSGGRTGGWVDERGTTQKASRM